MEGQLTELNERLEDEEDNNAEITAVKHKMEDEIEDLKQEVSELGTALDKVRYRKHFVKFSVILKPVFHSHMPPLLAKNFATEKCY